MTDVKVYPDKHMTLTWVPDGGIADIKSPTAAELNAGVPLSSATFWDSLDVNPTESSDLDDALITDSATAVEAGFDQYAATLPFGYPKDMTLTSDPFVIAYNVFAPGRVKGYIVRRFKPADVNTSTATDAYAAGDVVDLFYVICSYASQDTEGEDSTKYIVTTLPQGSMAAQKIVVSASAPVLSDATLAVGVGASAALTATLDGFPITYRSTWTTDDDTIATVSENGIVTGVSAGTATITIANDGATGTDTCDVTVS